VYVEQVLSDFQIIHFILDAGLH